MRRWFFILGAPDKRGERQTELISHLFNLPSESIQFLLLPEYRVEQFLYAPLLMHIPVFQIGQSLVHIHLLILAKPLIGRVHI